MTRLGVLGVWFFFPLLKKFGAFFGMGGGAPAPLSGTTVEAGDEDDEDWVTCAAFVPGNGGAGSVVVGLEEGGVRLVAVETDDAGN